MCAPLCGLLLLLLLVVLLLLVTLLLAHIHHAVSGFQSLSLYFHSTAFPHSCGSGTSSACGLFVSWAAAARFISSFMALTRLNR